MTDYFATQAELSDLSRRLNVIESLLFGAATQTPHPSLLVSLYWDACKGIVLDETNARHWERQLYRLDARALLLMARATRDPTCWHPFLVLLDRYINEGFDLETCRQHILGAAQDLLKLQGLRKIAPRDITGNPLRVKAILSAISRRGLHGQKITEDKER